MAQNQVYLIKSGENSFVEETQAIVGISGGKVGIGTTHPEADLHVTGSVKVDGDLTVDGTLTTINSSTVSVDDINIELGSTDSPTDATAEGGGITVKGSTNKTFNWHANGGWTSSENLSVADGKHFVGDELRALDAGGLNLFDVNQSGITIKGGKVGIHQTAPVYDLDVDGSGNFGSLYVDGNSVLTGEGSVFGKWEDGATAGEIFYTGGNVGVGITNPKHDFHVVGNGVVDGNFIVNGTSGTFNVSEFDVSGSNITLNSAGGGLGSNRGGLIVNGGDGTGKLEYLDSIQTWQSNQDIQIVADKHLQTDKVRAIDDGGLYLQDDGGNGIYIQDGGQVNIAGLTKADGGINVNGIFDIQNDGTLGSLSPNPDDVIKWNGTKWIASVSPGGGGGGSSEVPSAIINSLIADESIQEITYGPYDSTPRIATDLEIVGDGSVIPYALSGVSETGYFAVFSQEIPNNNYKIHTVFGGKDVYWETGSSSSIYYNDGDVSLQRNLTVGGNLTVAGNTTTLNTQTLEIEDHNIVIASNTGYNQLTDVHPVGGDYAGVFWGTGDAGAASPVSLTYQSNKGFAFEGGNVGIGTTGPIGKLSIEGSAATDYKTHIVFNNTGGSKNYAIGAGVHGSTNEGFGIINRNTNDPLLYINNGGNVGIGTTNPDARLEVKDTDNDLQMRIGSLSSAISPVIRLQGKNDSNTINRYADIKLDAENGVLTLLAPNTVAPNINAINVKQGGNVGIGTTSPDSLVEVYSDSGVGNTQLHIHNNSAGNAAVLKLEGGRAATDENTYQDVGQVLFANKGNITAGIRSYHQGDGKTSDNSFDDGDLRFLTSGHESSNVLTPRMVIDSGGNVGIGTTNPANKLTVLGDLAVGDNSGSDGVVDGIVLESTSASNYQNLITHTDNGLEFNNTSAPGVSRDFVFNGGDVGIGTASPTNKLDIVSDSANPGITVTNSSAGNPARLTLTNTEGSASVDCNNGLLRFGNNSADDLVIDSAGSVGIGTTSPGYELDVNGNVSANNFGFGTATTSRFYHFDSFSGGNFLGRGANDYTSLYDATTLSMVWKAGHVGIGTTDPAEILHLKEDAPEIWLESSNVNGNTYAVKSTSTGQFWIGMPTSAKTLSAGEARFTIDPAGSVGIGTTSPGGFKLNVQSDVNTAPIKGYRATTTTTAYLLALNSDIGTGGDVVKFRVEADGDVISATSNYTSDERAKSEISDLNYGLDAIKQLQPKQFKMRHSEEKGFKYGFIAQEAETILPDLIRNDGIEDGEGGSYKALEYNSIIAILTKAIQEQQQLIEQLKSQNESLATRISALES